MTKYERDPELVNFLSKVEDLDSKRYNNTSSSDSARQPLSSESNKASKHTNIRRADTMTGENEEDEDNLAYRSAYNYEMSFSPKKTHYSLNELDLERTTSNLDSKRSSSEKTKKFVISEEDYLLLQKLKASQSPDDTILNKFSPSFEREHRMPRRGQPRRDQPRRDQPRESQSKESQPRESQPRESQPRRSQPRKQEVVSIEYDFDFQERARSSSSSSSPPPPLPTRRSHVKVIENEEKPMLPTRPGKSEVTKCPLSGPTKSELTVHDYMKPKPPVSRSTKPTSFLSSLEDNKLTMAKTHQSEVETPKKTVVKSSHIDYLDSIQLKPTTLSPTLKTKPKPTPPSPPAKRLPRSESFIKSALNSNLTATSKPSLPEKPQKLRNSKRTVPKAKPSIPLKKVELNLVLPELRPVENSPTRQKFENSIDIPKLRASSHNVKVREENSIPEAIKKVQNLKKTQHEKPVIPQKKSSLTSNLKPTTIKNDDDVNKSNNEPEALSLRNNLKKRPPKAPERKISMPEALRKIELMKKSKTEPVLESANGLSINAKLDAIIASRNLRSSNTVPEFNSSQTNKEGSGDFNVSKDNAAKETKPLVHINKNRARGPKRKLPTHM